MTIVIPSHVHGAHGGHDPIQPTPVLPNLRDVSKEEREMFIQTLDALLVQHHQSLTSLSIDPSHEPNLSTLASELTSLTLKSAKVSFPLMGGSPHRSKTVLRLKRMRRGWIGWVRDWDRWIGMSNSDDVAQARRRVSE